MSNNYFIAEDHFDWARGGSSKMRVLSRMFKVLGLGMYLRARGSTGQMTNLEQRINLYHLVNRAAANNGVPGDVIELGSYTGDTAVLMQWCMQAEGQERTLHVYDSFEKSWGEEDPLVKLKQSFEQHCPEAVIHKGRFEQTVPSELPDQICFAHIDCAYGGPADELADTVYFLLQHIYPRMPAGAICVLMDYQPEGQEYDTQNINQGAQVGADRFLQDKPEKPISLFAELYCHAYFVKLPVESNTSGGTA